MWLQRRRRLWNADAERVDDATIGCDSIRIGADGDSGSAGDGDSLGS